MKVSLQDAIDRAGSPMHLLWRTVGGTWVPHRLPVEYAGWRVEQNAWHDTAGFMDVSFHMTTTDIVGPDAARLLAEHGIVDLSRTEVGRESRFVPVTEDGLVVGDVAALRLGRAQFRLSGVATAQLWAGYRARAGGYDVEVSTSSSAALGPGNPPRFRYQVHGPAADEVVAAARGRRLPTLSVGESRGIDLGGRHVRALRHEADGCGGWEIIGAWDDHAAVRRALLDAGVPFGMERIGGLAYPTSVVQSGRIPTPTAAIFTDPTHVGFRRELAAETIAANSPLYGSWFTDDIEHRYVTPDELGYGSLVDVTHDFVGRDALERQRSTRRRQKMLLVMDAEEVRTAIGFDLDTTTRNVSSTPSHRVEAVGKLMGVTTNTAWLHRKGTMIALALLDPTVASPGMRVDVVWGMHPGPGTPADADLGFPRVRASVAQVPVGAISAERRSQVA